MGKEIHWPSLSVDHASLRARIAQAEVDPVLDAGYDGGFFFQGCARPRANCDCAPNWAAARVCRYLTESPFILELERQHAVPSRQKYAYARAIVALHEAAHAVIGYLHIQYAGIYIAFKDPMSGFARDALGPCEPRANAASFYAGAVVDKMLLDTIEHAAHDAVSGREKLEGAYGPASAKVEQHEILIDVTRQLHAYWPSVESIATAAMKVETLEGRNFHRAAPPCWIEYRRAQAAAALAG